jgi:phage terminase small subunit
MVTPEKSVPVPPEHLHADAAAVWTEVVTAYGEGAEAIVGPDLDAYCGQVAALREAQARLLSEGLIIADPKGAPLPHPAVAIAKAAQAELRAFAGRFAPPPAPMVRRPGPMLDATEKAVAAAKHLQDRPEFAGAVEALLTLAWQIDEAQREGFEAFQKTAFGTIPTYLKACEALQVTPASVPALGEAVPAPAGKSGKLLRMQKGSKSA